MSEAGSSEVPYTITDRDLLKQTREGIEQVKALVVMNDAFGKVQALNNAAIKDGEIGDPKLTEALKVSLAAAARQEQILAHIVEGAELAPGATVTFPDPKKTTAGVDDIFGDLL